jgi:hypothetical protein
MPAASFPPDDMPQMKKEQLPVYEVQELPVERRVQPGKFYVQKNGELQEQERRQRVDAAEAAPARKPTPGR